MNIITNKQKFISQLLSGSTTARTCEDMDELVIAYSQMQCVAAGDPRVKEYIELTLREAELRQFEAEHRKFLYNIDKIAETYPKEIDRLKGIFEQNREDKKLADKAKSLLGGGKFEMEIGGKIYAERSDADEAIFKEILKIQVNRAVSTATVIGNFKGFEVLYKPPSRSGVSGFYEQKGKIILRGKLSYEAEASEREGGRNTIKLENLASGAIENRGEDINREINRLTAELKKCTIVNRVDSKKG
jgi:hypothetical protein